MDEMAFRQLVREMRDAQRRYFKSRGTDCLRAAKALEKRVDDVLDPKIRVDPDDTPPLFGQ